jgi:hypothetical protein
MICTITSSRVVLTAQSVCNGDVCDHIVIIVYLKTTAQPPQSHSGARRLEGRIAEFNYCPSKLTASSCLDLSCTQITTSLSTNANHDRSFLDKQLNIPALSLRHRTSRWTSAAPPIVCLSHCCTNPFETRQDPP